MMATMLQVFELRQRQDPSGKDIPLNIEWDDALVWYGALHHAAFTACRSLSICGCSSSPTSLSMFNHTEVRKDKETRPKRTREELKYSQSLFHVYRSERISDSFPRHGLRCFFAQSS